LRGLEGEMHPGFGEQRGSCSGRASAALPSQRAPDGAGIVTGEDVQEPSLAIDGENISIARTGLSVRHRCYRPSRYDPLCPWEIRKALLLPRRVAGGGAELGGHFAVIGGVASARA
jgi:hypothetical protein